MYEQDPGAIGPKTAEHLERLFADAFKREVDQEENVARTLPFFATAIGTILATIGLLRPASPGAAMAGRSSCRSSWGTD